MAQVKMARFNKYKRAAIWLFMASLIVTIVTRHSTRSIIDQKDPIVDLPEFKAPPPMAETNFTFYIDVNQPLMIVYTFPTTAQYLVDLTLGVDPKFRLTKDTIDHGFMFLSVTKSDGRYMMYPFRSQIFNYGDGILTNHSLGDQIFMGYVGFEYLRDYLNLYNRTDVSINQTIRNMKVRPRHIIHCNFRIAAIK